MSYISEVQCDVCDDVIVGPVYFRDDLLVCRPCALDINNSTPRNYTPFIYLTPVACLGAATLMYVQLPVFLFLLIAGISAMAFLFGVLKTWG